MDFLQTILGPFRSFVSKLMFLWVKVHILPKELAALNIDPHKPVIYVQSEPGLSNSLAIEQAITSAGLPGMDNAKDLGMPELKRALFVLNKRNRVKRASNTARQPKILVALIEHVIRTTGQDVQIVPVSCFWGRSPSKESSLFKVMFSDSWARPSVLGKFFRILIYGRQTYVQVSPSLSLQQLIGDEISSEIAARKAHRVLRVHFRRQKEATIGPDLSHRRTLLFDIVNAPEVRKEIEAHSQDSGKSVEKVEEEAIQYANEVAADYSHSAIRFLELLLSFLWQKIYNGTQTTGLERVAETARDHEIVFLPCHRSHIDYLLLSYVIYRNGLMPPHIAAGINLNLPVVGPILRRAGAFFMRRSFRNNKLYSAVFAEYINLIMNKGFPIEYFIEGGRSRSGRLLAPKTGMLAMTVKSYIKGAKNPVALVPVYIGYEKIIESGSYIKELHGSKKKKESLGGLINSLKRLRDSFGKVYLNFGEPVNLGKFVEKKNGAPLGIDSPELPEVVNGLALECIEGINRAAVVNPVNLLAICLLATHKHSIDRTALARQIQCYQKLFSVLDYAPDCSCTEDSPEQVILHGEQLGFINIIQHPLGDVVSSDDGGSLLLTYFRNNALHIYAVPALISCLFVQNETMSRNAIISLCKSVHPFLKSELFIHWSPDDLDLVIDRVLAFFLQERLIRETANQEVYAAATRSSGEYLVLDLLSRCILQTIERYFIVIYLLVHKGSGKLSTEELEEQSHLVAQRLSLMYEFNSPEFSDKNLFSTFVDNLQKIDLVSIDESGNYVFGEQLEAVNKGASSVLAEDIQYNIIEVIKAGVTPDALAPENQASK